MRRRPAASRLVHSFRRRQVMTESGTEGAKVPMDALGALALAMLAGGVIPS
jgi:hypothetical protein